MYYNNPNLHEETTGEIITDKDLKITNLKNDDSYKKQWFWTENINGELNNYCTDRDGEGLFYDNDRMSQLMGTCDFYLKGSKSAVYSKLRRILIKDNNWRNDAGV